jgi:hypothetical protein
LFWDILEELTPSPSLSREGKKGIRDFLNPPNKESGQAPFGPGAIDMSPRRGSGSNGKAHFTLIRHYEKKIKSAIFRLSITNK